MFVDSHFSSRDSLDRPYRSTNEFIGPATQAAVAVFGIARSTDHSHSPVCDGESPIRRRKGPLQSGTDELARFAPTQLLNGSSPLPLVPNPRSTSFVPQTLDVNLLRLSLGLPHHASPPGSLPTFTFNSPVDHSRAGAPANSSWKVALFALHTAMMANRAHPTDGFLINPASRKTVSPVPS